MEALPAFKSAETAWFWCMAQMKQPKTSNGRDPNEIIQALDLLYRRRRIDSVHARILRIWGEKQTAPNPEVATERCDWRLWNEALQRLEWPLRVRGIVA